MSLRERIGRHKKALGREWVILAASVLIAGLIWFLSQLSNVYTGTISVPVVAQCNIDGHRGTSANTVVVSARCRTDGFRLVREHSRKEKKVVTVAFDRGDLRRTGPDTFSVIGGAKNNYIGQFFGEGTVESVDESEGAYTIKFDKLSTTRRVAFSAFPSPRS